MLARRGNGACPVCSWAPDEGASVPSRYCACCGIERGVQDRSADQVKSWRSKWLTSGGRWLGPAAPQTRDDATIDSNNLPPRL
jgi:hypothetical protein